jgi:hypothetical protein
VLDILDSARNQDAVYWPPAGTDRQGQVKYGPPVGLRVWWADTNELIVDKNGQQRVSRSKVLGPDQPADVDFKVDGILKLGTVASLGGVDLTKPRAIPDAFVIYKADKTPTVDGDQFARVAWL